MSGSIVPNILPQIVVAAGLGAAAAAGGGSWLALGFTPFTALGVAISLFLGFRNNASYSRWWEARKQWGKQLITVRNFARTLTCMRVEEAGRRAVVRLSAAHSLALRTQLRHAWVVGLAPRRGQPVAELGRTDYDHSGGGDHARLLEGGEQATVAASHNAADAILRLIAERLGTMRRADGAALDSYSLVALSHQLDRLGEVQGACERVASTPLPFVYALLVYRTSCIYILLAPFAMVTEMGWYTPAFNAIVAYTFFGLDELARQLESPFGVEPQCLALDAICRTIELSAAEAVGDRAPLPVVAKDHNLM